MIILNNAYAIVRTWLHQPLWGGSDAPGPEGCVPKGCESLSSPPETASLVMVGDGSGLQQSTAPQADGSSAAKVKGDHVEYKYPLPEKPPFATEIKETLSTAAPPDLSNQGKPRGRKSHASKAIAQGLGDASDEETNGDESKTARKGKPATKAKSKTAKGKGRGRPHLTGWQSRRPRPRRKPVLGETKPSRTRAERVERKPKQMMSPRPKKQEQHEQSGWLPLMTVPCQPCQPGELRGWVPVTSQTMHSPPHPMSALTMSIPILTESIWHPNRMTRREPGQWPKKLLPFSVSMVWCDQFGPALFKRKRVIRSLCRPQPRQYPITQMKDIGTRYIRIIFIDLQFR